MKLRNLRTLETDFPKLFSVLPYLKPLLALRLR